MKAMWEMCYQAMLHEKKKLPTAASRDDIHEALQEIADDLKSTWLKPEKIQRILPNLRTIARRHGCLEQVEQIQALLPNHGQKERKPHDRITA